MTPAFRATSRATDIRIEPFQSLRATGASAKTIVLGDHSFTNVGRRQRDLKQRNELAETEVPCSESHGVIATKN